MLNRRVIQSRFARRNLDPALPLYVLRRIPGAHGTDGVQRVHLAGETFSPAGIDPRRLGFLYRNRYIGHEPPRAQAQAIPPMPAPPPPVVVTAVVPVAEVAPPPAPIAPPPAPVVEAPRPAIKASAVVAPRASLVAPKPPGTRRPGV